IDDAAYPARLRAIFDPPSPLYVRGELRPADESAVAIVGARRATEYGKAVAEHLAGELVRHGMTVVSGMARGIDAAAHRGALAAGGRTIAVLGCGPDVVYPPEHSGLMREIIGQGAVMSEFAAGATFLRSCNYPRWRGPRRRGRRWKGSRRWSWRRWMLHRSMSTSWRSGAGVRSPW